MLAQAVSNGTNLSIFTTNIVINLFPFDPSSPPSSSAEDEVKVSFPSGIHSPCSDTKLSKVLYKGSLHQGVAPVGFTQASDTFSLDLYSCEQKLPVRGLDENIVLEFPINRTDPNTSQQLLSIANGSASSDNLLCSFLDTQTGSISSEGCSLLELTTTSIKCACDHLTDFMAFLKSGEDVITSANYNVFRALPELTFANLQRNLGFHFFLGFWSVFLFSLFLLLLLNARRFSHNKFFYKLYASLNKQEQLMKSMEEGQVEHRLDRLEKDFYKDKKVHPLPQSQPSA